jgi:hypothetical protein
VIPCPLAQSRGCSVVSTAVSPLVVVGHSHHRSAQVTNSILVPLHLPTLHYVLVLPLD